MQESNKDKMLSPEMEPRIELLKEKKLIGKKITMSFTDNKTYFLWNGFMPRRKEIKNNLNSDLISMQVYDRSYDFENFNPYASFEKWAAIEVTDFNFVPP